MSLLRLTADESGSRGFRLRVAHVDHGLRSDSGRDADRTRDLAGSMGLPFFLARIEPERWSRRRGTSPEEAARLERRMALRRLAQETGASWILLGHTRSDQTETLLLNLLRGAGVRGLAGMSPIRPPWLRPLLGISREDIRDYATRLGLSWLEDPSNLDDRFLRNRIRLRLLPLLREEYQPAVDRVLSRTAETLIPIRRYLRDSADQAWRTVCISESSQGIRLDRAGLAGYHRAVTEEVLRRAYRNLRGNARDLKRAHLEGLVRALRPPQASTFHLPAGIRVRFDHREICFTHQTQQEAGSE